MNRVYKVIVLFVLLLFCFIFNNSTIIIPCFFKSLFHISCPMCGLTRSIRALLNGNISLSFYYNIFGFVVLIFLIINVILLLYDIIFNKKKLEYLYTFIGNYYLFIIFLFLFYMILNNIKGI